MTGETHLCPGVEPVSATTLLTLLRAEPWLMRALAVVAASDLPDAWIGAGVLRDVAWGQQHGGFNPAEVNDIDVAFFDPDSLSRDRDLQAQEALAGLAELPWEATNQAAVHTWYHPYFGGLPVQPFACVHDAVATWPETATCVAVRQRRDDCDLEVCAPYGLADLLDGIWRANPLRVTPEVSMARLARQRVAARWPGVTIVRPHGCTDAAP
jgi:uncharacterized protein